jgi:hypothetical protein
MRCRLSRVFITFETEQITPARTDMSPFHVNMHATSCLQQTHERYCADEH